MARDALQKTAPIQQLMRRCWRNGEPAPDVAYDDIAKLLHIVTSTGSGPLVWNRMRTSLDFAITDSAKAIRETYQITILFSALQRKAIERIVEILKSAGIVPIIFKGWSVAQFYAMPDLRPSGDIDLCAPPGRYEETARLLAAHASTPPATGFQISERETGLSLELGLPGQVSRVDLHRDLDRYLQRSSNDVYARSQLVPVEEMHIRVLAPEDHLRLLCLHFLGHGGWRPIWLCDIGAMLENLPANFDWELCLGDNALRRHWVLTVISLAHDILGADLGKLPSQYHTDLPKWSAPAILKQWGRPFDAYMAKPLYTHVLRETPWLFLREFLARWPDPIRATYHRGARFDSKPRWPYQITFFVRTAFSFLFSSAR